MTLRSVLVGVATWVILGAALRVFVVPPEACGDVTTHDIRLAADSARRWVQNAQRDDGRYVYLYHAAIDAVPADYNEVRHAGVTMALYQAAGRSGDRATLEQADAAMTWMTDRLLRRDGWAALLSPGGQRAKLGASALMLAGLAERRLATADGRYDDLMRELGSFLAAMQRPDGGFHVAWLVRDGAPQRFGTSRFYPGESLWALALLHEAFPGEGWDRHARAAVDFLTTRRDELEGVRHPPFPDQWTAYGLAEMVDWGLGDEQIDYARRLAARFGLFVRTESQREHGSLGRLVRGDRARASGIGTWVEGLASLWRVAAADERLAGLRPKIEERLTCVAGILAARQFDAQAARGFARPELVEGAWFIDGVTRMDDQQHAFSGLLYAADALEGRTRREPDAPLPAVPRG